ncbi:unnamed protein product [Haemonchus placei]|uniref:Uncharacterized protein n=1 Tax=Haemonchus placei TaxID=6290 RepID=A0A3P7YF42_HAEPC|nr:unnamed protein product [Haemonchus placei]
MNQLLKSRSDSNSYSEEVTTYQPSLSDNEDNDLPITYGLVIHKLEDFPVEQSETNEQLDPVADDLRTAQKRRRDCVRDQPLPQEEIDAYIARNKSKV